MFLVIGKTRSKRKCVLLQSEMAPRYEICVGLEKGHKTTPNTLVTKPSKKKVGSKFQSTSDRQFNCLLCSILQGQLTKHNKFVRDLIREVKALTSDDQIWI